MATRAETAKQAAERREYRAVQRRLRDLEATRERQRRNLRQSIRALKAAADVGRRYEQKTPAGSLFGAVIQSGLYQCIRTLEGFLGAMER